ncbi:MAG: ATP-binding protein [Planctomycetota bacterium]
MTSGSGSLHQAIRADAVALRQLVLSIEQFLVSRGVGNRAVFAAGLVIEELVGNVIRHGYRGRTDSEVSVTLRLAPEEFELTIVDTAPPFDPFTYQATRSSEPVPASSPGGRGLALVIHACSRVGYQRVGDRNVVTVTLPRTDRSADPGVNSSAP